MEVPKNIKNRTIIWSSNSPFGYLSKGNRITISKRYLHFHLYCNIIARTRKQPVSIDGWMDKENEVHICYRTWVIKNEILLLVTIWMDLESIVLSEIGQTKTKTIWFHLYMCSNNNQLIDTESWLGFPHSSVSKESACNAGDHGSIPGSGRSPGEGNGSPL